MASSISAWDHLFMDHALYKFLNYLLSSVGGQDEPNRTLWLATRAGRIKLCSPLGFTRCIPQEKFPRKLYNKSFIDQGCSVKMAGYWPRSFFASLWTSTSSRSINSQKKHLANIQPFWPHPWSITHIYRVLWDKCKNQAIGYEVTFLVINVTNLKQTKL